MARTPNTVTVSVASCDDVNRRALAAFGGERQDARISFASIELLWQVLTPKRWEVLRAMAGQGGMALREIARRLGRDVKAVHGDVHALLAAGLIERDPAGRFVFPYDGIHVEFDLVAA